MTLSQRLTSLNENFCEWRHDSMERGLGRKERGKEETATEGRFGRTRPSPGRLPEPVTPNLRGALVGTLCLDSAGVCTKQEPPLRFWVSAPWGGGSCFPTTDTLEMPRMKLQRFHLDMSPFPVCAVFLPQILPFNIPNISFM